MEKATIQHIIRELGYEPVIRKGRGETRYVLVFRGGSSRVIGHLDELVAMNRDDLESRIETRCEEAHWHREATPVLTHRQSELLSLIVQGLDNKEIAVMLGCKVNTVGKHTHDILTLFGLQNRTQLAIYAFQAGIIDLSEITLPTRKPMTDNNFFMEETNDDTNCTKDDRAAHGSFATRRLRPR